MSSWKDITIEKYDKIAALQSEGVSEIDLIARSVAILDGVSVDEVEAMPYALLLLKARNLRFLQSNPIPSIAKGKYTLDGKTFTTTLRPDELTTAQYIDFQVIAANTPSDLAGLLSIILVPEGCKYNEGYRSDDVREIIYKNMPIEDAMGLSAFFFALWKKSIRRLLGENRKALQKLKRKKVKTAKEMQLIQKTEELIGTIEKAIRYS